MISVIILHEQSEIRKNLLKFPVNNFKVFRFMISSDMQNEIKILIKFVRFSFYKSLDQVAYRSNTTIMGLLCHNNHEL